MKTSLKLSMLLPTALALGAVVGCSHGSRVTTVTPRPAAGINEEDISRSPSASIEDLLMSRVPGLYVTRARDGHMVMHLRGMNTLNDEQEPLFVVDGIALGSAGNLAAINRFDIASIEVLKDPASTAAWGMRGANGVIVIKTKS